MMPPMDAPYRSVMSIEKIRRIDGFYRDGNPGGECSSSLEIMTDDNE